MWQETGYKTGLIGHIVLENSLSLPRPLANQLLSHAQKNPDNEVCGLIGRDQSDHHNIDYYPVSNIADDTAHRFEMEPKQQIAAMKQMRDRNQALFAIVHSHPSAQATPSSIDLERIEYDDVYYLIISLNTKGVLDMRSYLLRGNGMQEVELLLEHDD